MMRPKPVRPEHYGIFRGTQNGVPNPFAVVEHGYPTRYHGPSYRWVQPGHRYVRQPYAKAPFLGVGDTSFEEVMASRWMQALMGASAGYLVAPSGSKLVYSAAGAGSMMLLGNWALAAILVAGAAAGLAGKKMPALQV